jgi:hypothetical protein
MIALFCLPTDMEHVMSLVMCVAGDDVPKGRDAVGWRIAVYWKDDRTFYEGELADYEPSAGRHKVRGVLTLCYFVIFSFGALLMSSGMIRWMIRLQAVLQLPEHVHYLHSASCGGKRISPQIPLLLLPSCMHRCST